MKNEAIISLVALLLLATLVTESDCFAGPFQGGKRELKEEVSYFLQTFILLCFAHDFRQERRVASFVSLVQYNNETPYNRDAYMTKIIVNVSK